MWRRLGAKASNAMGTKWQSVTGRLRQVSVGQAGVWGVSPSNEVGLKGLPVNEEGMRGIPNVEVGLRGIPNIMVGQGRVISNIEV